MQMNEFQEHVKKVQAETRDRVYGWWNLEEDAKKVGLELELDILSATKMGPGFNIGFRARYDDCHGKGRCKR